MKLIRDFRLLESLTELEAELEAPKYHARDIQDETKRMKLLTENPNALVKFHNVVVREDNPKFKNWNATQQKRMHRIKYRLAKMPPLDFIANNIVESNFFKKAIKFIIHVNLWTLLIQTSMLTEFTHSPENKPPAGLSQYLLPDQNFRDNVIEQFRYYELQDGEAFDRASCKVSTSRPLPERGL